LKLPPSFLDAELNGGAEAKNWLVKKIKAALEEAEMVARQ
jgi:hypothetical protein